ncbi:unnamed protein product [Sympodiomycopsis kandeliae]
MSRSIISRQTLGICRTLARSQTATTGTIRPCLSVCKGTTSRIITPQHYGYATSTTSHSTIADPSEKEAQQILEKGHEQLEIGNWDGARDYYLQSNKIKETASTHFNLGVVYFQLKDLPNSIKSFEKSLQMSPDSPDAHTNLASAYIMSSPPRPDLATEHLKKASLLDPEDGEIWFNLGAVLEACEQLEESVKAYRKASEMGIDRAEQNYRNVSAKILAAKLTAPEHLKEVAESEEKQRQKQEREEK